MAAARGLFKSYSLVEKLAKPRYLTNRSYSQRFHRNPIKVFSAEEYADISKSKRKSLVISDSEFSQKKEINNRVPTSKQSQSIKHDTKKFQPRPQIAKKEVQNSKDHQLEVIDDRQSAERKLGSYMQMVKSCKARKAHGKIMLEGERLIGDAIKAGITAEALFCSRKELIESLPRQMSPSTPVYLVNYNKIQLWSELTTSPGIMGIFDLVNVENNTSNIPGHLPLTVLCDEIKDPGNMGSLLRCAAAIGCEQFITTKGCVDIWDSKVLRSAVGAHFRIRKALGIEWNTMCNYIPDDATIILADSSIIDAEKTFDQDCLAEMLIKAEEASQNCISLETDDSGNVQMKNESYNDEKLLEVYRHLPLPTSPYDQFKLKRSNKVCLVIGGEARGISSFACKLAHDLGGIKVSLIKSN